MNDQTKALQVDHSTGEIMEAGNYKPMLPQEVLDRRDVIKTIMTRAMVADVHYGTIPGTKGKSLLKLGADMLMSVFHIAADPEIHDLSNGHGDALEIRYRVLLRGKAMGSGQLVGVGVGECSSNEEKYRWKKAPNNVWNNTPERMRRIKYFDNGSVKQVRQSPFDIANTVLKMAKKRAAVDFTLTALGAAEMFEDFEDGNGHAPQAPQQQYQAPAPVNDDQSWAPPDHAPYSAQDATGAPADEPVAEGKATGEQIHKLRKAADQAGFRDIDVLAQFEVVAWNELTPAQVEQALKWIADTAP